MSQHLQSPADDHNVASLAQGDPQQQAFTTHGSHVHRHTAQHSTARITKCHSSILSLPHPGAAFTSLCLLLSLPQRTHGHTLFKVNLITPSGSLLCNPSQCGIIQDIFYLVSLLVTLQRFEKVSETQHRKEDLPEEGINDEASDVVLRVPQHCGDAVQHLGTHSTADPTRPRGGGRGGVLWPGQGRPQTVVVVIGDCGNGLGRWGGDGVVEPRQQDRHTLHAAAAHTQLVQQGDGCVQVGAS